MPSIDVDKQKEYQRKYYLENRDKKLKQFSDRYKANPEKYINKSKKYNSTHLDNVRKNYKKWSLNNPEKLHKKDRIRYDTNKEYFSDWHLKSEYGISLEEYNAMYKHQNGKCLICGEYKKRLVVDHNHENGKVRGLLCHTCNTAIGFMKESISSFENAITYLKERS